jgi:hypothetical protein
MVDHLRFIQDTVKLRAEYPALRAQKRPAISHWFFQIRLFLQFLQYHPSSDTRRVNVAGWPLVRLRKRMQRDLPRLSFTRGRWRLKLLRKLSDECWLATLLPARLGR